MRYSILFSLLFFLLLNACAAKIPDKFPAITTQELSQGVRDKSLHVYDNNIATIYQAGHIPTAVFMDYLAPDVGLLPADKNAPLVFYCKNTRCSASEAGARFSWYQGYRNIRVYPEGIDGWKQVGMETEPAD